MWLLGLPVPGHLLVYPQLLGTTEVVVCSPAISMVSIVAFTGCRCDEPYSVGGTITMKAVWRKLMWFSTRAMTAAMDIGVIATCLWFSLGSCVDLLGMTLIRATII